MRDLKFRAYIDGEMVILPFAALQYFDFEGSYAMSFVVDGYAGFWGHEQYESATKEKCKGAPIMQYIGLKDKNGVEIYDGDIIKRTQQIDGNFVSRIFDTYEVAYNSQIAGFEYKPIEDKQYKQYTVRPFGGEELEVIGNIHQNKELKTA
jgi:uncharacterized phage protein (TIGR01671 family)